MKRSVIDLKQKRSTPKNINLIQTVSNVSRSRTPQNRNLTPTSATRAPVSSTYGSRIFNQTSAKKQLFSPTNRVPSLNLCKSVIKRNTAKKQPGVTKATAEKPQPLTGSIYNTFDSRPNNCTIKEELLEHTPIAKLSSRLEETVPSSRGTSQDSVEFNHQPVETDFDLDSFQHLRATRENHR